MQAKSKILIVEDNKNLSSLFAFYLEKEGYVVDYAYDGEEALAKLKTYVPDLVMLDLILPKKDGFSFLEDMRKDEAFSKVLVLMVTNINDPKEINRAMKLGAQDYMLKSNISQTYLIAKINSLLAG